MKQGDWLKCFSSKKNKKFYHIINIENEDQVSMEKYIYNPLLKKVLKVDTVNYSLEWLMEQILKNNIYEISEKNIPFLFKF